MEYREKLFYGLTKRRDGARGSVVVKELCYKPEGRGFQDPTS
jgi:hypothetical protein